MTIDEQIENFKLNYKLLNDEHDEQTKEIVGLFRNKVSEILPLITFMKDRMIYFSHPDLDESIRTSVGVIVGRNTKSTQEIYVYDGKQPLIRQVSLRNLHESTDVSPVTFYEFISNCDLEFAFKGIEYTKNMLSLIVDELQKVNAKRRDFLANIK